MEISPESQVKGQVLHLEGGDGKEGNGRQILESPRGCGTHQPWEGTFPRMFKVPDVTQCINHQEPPFPTLFPPSRGNRCKGIIWKGKNWGPNHIGSQFRVPALPLVPLGEWPTWSRPGKWLKWAMQPFIKIWHYFDWLFTVVYLHDQITYSCIKYIEML